jgi:hypothetical protein
MLLLSSVSFHDFFWYMEDGKASDLPSSHPSSHMHSVEKLECFMMECVLYNMPWIALFLLTLCLLQLPVHTDGFIQQHSSFLSFNLNYL